jgi:hypothetical protein
MKEIKTTLFDKNDFCKIFTKLNIMEQFPFDRNPEKDWNYYASFDRGVYLEANDYMSEAILIRILAEDMELNWPLAAAVVDRYKKGHL